jgi:hypothetical protein
MENKKFKLTKEAWQNAGIKKGYFKSAEEKDRMQKEAFAPLVTGLLGGVAGMAGNYLYDKYKSGDWKERLFGYGIPQEKINQIKQVLQQSEATFANIAGMSPQVDEAIKNFKEQTQASLQRAEEENNAAGKGNAQMAAAELARKQQQGQVPQGQQAGQAQQGAQSSQPQQTQQEGKPPELLERPE